MPPSSPLSPPNVYIQDTQTIKGLGVFAAQAYSAGDFVEICPVLVIHAPFLTLPEDIKTRVFNWEVLAQVAGTHAIALGYGSLYNHDNPSNMRYEADQSNALLRFIAVKNIRAGEELTINYNAYAGGFEWHDDNWFERMRVQPI